MTDKLANRLEIPKTDIDEVIEKTITNTPNQQNDNTKKEDTKNEEDIKNIDIKELVDVFSKESKEYQNIKEDHQFLRNSARDTINKITLVINLIMGQINADVSGELIKSFAALLKAYNDISNSLSTRNAELHKSEIETFKNKLEILSEFFEKEKKDNEGNSSNSDGTLKKKTLEELVKVLKRD